MKLLYRGGLNKYESDGYLKSYFYEYSEEVNKLLNQGKNIGFITLAKPDKYYNEHIIPQFGNKVVIIDRKSEVDDWKKYDLLFLCGGDTTKLKSGLQSKGFEFSRLKDDIVILGDSAGAMLMAPWFYDTEDKINIDFHKGIFPKTNTIVIVHRNNPRYCTPELEKSVNQFAAEKELVVLSLAEN